VTLLDFADASTLGAAGEAEETATDFHRELKTVLWDGGSDCRRFDE